MQSNKNDITIKLLVVGDASASKTNLLFSYIQNQNKPENMPQVFDNFTLKMNVGNTTVNLSLSDGAGGEKFIRLRSLNYLNKDIILLLFSVRQNLITICF